MRRLLAHDAAALRALVARPLMLAFDFDGTLAPIVARRETARMRRATARRFALVCARYPTVVVTGRRRADVLPRLEGAPVKAVVGHHGLETGARGAAHAKGLAEVRAALRTLAAALPGLDVEDKGASLSVHVRRVRRPGAALAQVRRALGALATKTRLVAGKQVLNVLPAGAPHKGDAVVALRERLGVEVALFVGDDVTDEDVFRLAAPGKLVGVRVGASRRSAADWFLRDQREVDGLLEWLVTLRPRPGT